MFDAIRFSLGELLGWCTAVGLIAFGAGWIAWWVRLWLEDRAWRRRHAPMLADLRASLDAETARRWQRTKATATPRGLSGGRRA